MSYKEHMQLQTIVSSRDNRGRMENAMHNAYTYRIVWSEDHIMHIGLCAEFPLLSHRDPDPAQALAGIMGLVSQAIEELLSEGGVAPVPIFPGNYSGRFLARVAPEIHRTLALEAAEHKMSMNRWIAYKLTIPCR